MVIVFNTSTTERYMLDIISPMKYWNQRHPHFETHRL